MGLYSGGLIIGRIFVSEIWGAYFREGLLSEGLIIEILRYMIFIYSFFQSRKNNFTMVCSKALFRLGAMPMPGTINVHKQLAVW